MRPDVPREFLRALAPDLGWPAGWRHALDACPPLTPPERLALLVRAWRQVLVASEGGRARLRAWLDGTRRRTETPEALRARIRDELLLCGDKELVPVAVEAFARAPAPVREVLLRQVAVLAVGASTNGWTAPSRMVDRDDRPRERIIVIHGVDRTFPELLKTFLHELGHCWHAPLTAEYDACITALGMVGLQSWAADSGLSDQYAAQEARGERLADACAFAWGRWA